MLNVKAKVKPRFGHDTTVRTKDQNETINFPWFILNDVKPSTQSLCNIHSASSCGEQI